MISKIETYAIVPFGESKTPSLDDIKQCVEIAKSHNCIVSLSWIMWSGKYERFISKDDDPQEFYEKKLPKVYGM